METIGYLLLATAAVALVWIVRDTVGDVIHSWRDALNWGMALVLFIAFIFALSYLGAPSSLMNITAVSIILICFLLLLLVAARNAPKLPTQDQDEDPPKSNLWDLLGCFAALVVTLFQAVGLKLIRSGHTKEIVAGTATVLLTTLVLYTAAEFWVRWLPAIFIYLLGRVPVGLFYLDNPRYLQSQHMRTGPHPYLTLAEFAGFAVVGLLLTRRYFSVRSNLLDRLFVLGGVTTLNQGLRDSGNEWRYALLALGFLGLPFAYYQIKEGPHKFRSGQPLM